MGITGTSGELRMCLCLACMILMFASYVKANKPLKTFTTVDFWNVGFNLYCILFTKPLLCVN